MDREIIVNALVTVLVAGNREDPIEDAKALVRDALSREVRTPNDWDNRFAIIPAKPGAATVHAQYAHQSSD